MKVVGGGCQPVVVLDAAKGPPEQALDSTGQWQGGADHARVLGALLLAQVCHLALRYPMKSTT